MAFLTVSNRVVSSRGTLKQETGQFTDVGGGNYQIRTKLGQLVFVRVQGLNTVSDNAVELYMNSTNNANNAVAGAFHIESGATSGGAYMYKAIGRS